MKTIITNSNLQTEISYSISGKTPNGWRIESTIVQRTLIGAKKVSQTNRTWTLIDTPSSVDAGGNVIEGTTEYTDWRATWITDAELDEATYAAIMTKEKIAEWDGSVIDDLENSPDVGEVKEWSEVLGTLVVKGNVVLYTDGEKYVVEVAHTVQENWNPIREPKFWKKIIPELPPNTYNVWVQPVSGDPNKPLYPVGAIVHFPTLSDPLYIVIEENSPEGNSFAPNVWGWQLYTP